jgi:hypothetical protein
VVSQGEGSMRPVPWPARVLLMFAVVALIAGALAGDFAETAANGASL